MSYYMEQFDQAFRIAAENKAAAFEALKGWAQKELERNAVYAHLNRSPMDAPSRYKLVERFGRNTEVYPDDVVKITYGRKVLYERNAEVSKS